MWTRVELKNYAKDFLKKHYWKAFVVCLIFSILTGGNGSSGGRSDHDDFLPLPSFEKEFQIDNNNFFYEIRTGGVRELINSLGLFPTFFIGSTLFAAVLILWIVSMLIRPLITVGKNRFFLKGFDEDVNIRYLFSTFNRDEFWGIFKCMFITGIKNFLWFFLLIIPGIIKFYEYRMVSYLLVNDTSLTSSEAIQISRQLTDGHKWSMFVLDLSFIGWYILGGLLFVIGTFFVVPYHEATIARLFNVLSGNDKNTDDNYRMVYE